MSLLYRSSYVNVVLAGRTRDGASFALVTGKHAPHYPYDHPASQWDDVLLAVGGERVSLHAPALAELRLDVPAGGPARGRGRLAFQGTGQRPDGRTAEVRFDLPCSYARFRPYQLARRYNVFDLDWVPGLRWQPFEIAGGEGQSVTIDGTSWEIAQSYGELERGLLSNFRSPRFAFRYDYLGLASPGEAPYAFTRFVSRALHPEGAFGRVFDAYLRWSASEVVTLEAGALVRGDAHGADMAGGAELSVLTHHVVSLGYADLDRQLVETTDAAGRSAFGLREIFTAR